MSSLPQPGLNETLERILAISQKMNSERELSSLLDLIAREATSLLDCDRASIFLLDRERNELWSKVALGSEEILRFDAPQGYCRQQPRRPAKPLMSRMRTATRASTRRSTDRPATARATCSPCRCATSSGEIIGAFEVAQQTGRRVHRRATRSRCTALASHAAIAIETAQLIGELRRNQDELAAAERAPVARGGEPLRHPRHHRDGSEDPADRCG